MATIDLSLLPAPDVVEALDYETVFAQRKASFLALVPEDIRDSVTAALELESEPLTILLQESAYRELLLRNRINAAARSVMLAYATGSDLDHLAALFGVTRIDGEEDSRLRARTQLSLEGYSTAGPTLSYVFHATSASNEVHDATVNSPEPGTVHVVVLAVPSDDHPNGVPNQTLLDTVQAKVSADDIRPLTDYVQTVPAQVILYPVDADIFIAPGPDAGVVLSSAMAALNTYTAQQFGLGRDITISGIHAALHQPGVTRVDLLSPAANMTIQSHQAARCSGVNLRISGIAT
jgi:phage-related baseplate assembly protein